MVKIILTSLLIVVITLLLLVMYEETVREKAYFEGQKDALNGDIRIHKTSDSTWAWSESCWNNGDTPTYNPN